MDFKAVQNTYGRDALPVFVVSGCPGLTCNTVAAREIKVTTLQLYIKQALNKSLVKIPTNIKS